VAAQHVNNYVMKVLIAGGDGFCGWPTALHLSQRGHQVFVVDDLSRRAIDAELETESLTPIQSLPDRLAAWRRRSGQSIMWHDLHVGANLTALCALLRQTRPDAIVHFAEQRSAPYSMRSAADKRSTISGNSAATHDLLIAMTEICPECHLVHLGTMGVYGYDVFGDQLDEGYMKVVPYGAASASALEIFHPMAPGSIYHLSKCQDELLFQFYNRNDGIAITDLHQGIVWGTETKETDCDVALINRFDYDAYFGTVLNRFIVEAALDHPLTVYGSGGQQRAFININDAVRCIGYAIENPPIRGHRVRIINQMTETYRVGELASLVAKMTGTKIQHLVNPRQEAEANRLIVRTDTIRSFGLKATTLSDALILEIRNVAAKYIHRCDRSRIVSETFWNARRRAAAGLEPDVTGELAPSLGRMASSTNSVEQVP
jgi:UDP-sulfoquinovose synthase